MLPFFGSVKKRHGHLSRGALRRAVTVSGLLLLVVYVSSSNFHRSQDSSSPHLPSALALRASRSSGATVGTPTNLSHVVFAVISSLRTWKGRKAYLESWWQPNITRGYLFLDGHPQKELLCPSTCPHLLINEEIRKWRNYRHLKDAVRMVQSIVEAFQQRDPDVRWFVTADDDSVLFPDNIVQVLSKYDHTKYYYLGANSETILSNAYFSFDMGFGGAGYALSYPLVAAIAKQVDGCVKRYPYRWHSDFLIYVCVSDLGVAMSPLKGFHQIDLTGSIKGLLSSHPQSPLLSLHHIDAYDPIFPSLSRSESISHLMDPAGVDQSRLLQQTICYQREKNWSISVSWGYSAHIYESILPPHFLRRPLETFQPWMRAKWPRFMFNPRPVKDDPCEAPHWFFFESVESNNEDDILTTYTRAEKRRLGPCSQGGNHSADYINSIQVFSPARIRLEAERAECCDVLSAPDKNTTTVRIRPCLEAEEIL